MHRLAIILLAPLLPVAACTEQVIYSTWDQFRKGSVGNWADRQPDTSGPRRSLTRGEIDHLDWAIVLDAFDGADARQRAGELIARLRDEDFVPDLWLKQNGEQWYVLRGRYESPMSNTALKDLRQTRTIKLVDERPFESANLVRLSTMARPGSLDVRQYKEQWPYTLQIAAYEQGYGSDRRKAAEQHAARLRKQEHQAFYLHGPNMSMVTIGLFSDKDRVQGTHRVGRREVTQFFYGPRIRDVQKHFPHNKVNGEVFYEPTIGGKKRPQPSMLIAIK